METLTIVCLCALALAAIVAGVALKRRAARLRMQNVQVAQPVQRRLPERATPPVSNIDAEVRNAWRACGDAHRSVKQVPDCERAQAQYKLAVNGLGNLSRILQDGITPPHAISMAAAAVVRHSQDAVHWTREFQLVGRLGQ
jgi:hypothetical protein